MWKYIKRGRGLFSSCVRYEVGDGAKVRFCPDLWCGEQRLEISCLVLHVLRTWVADHMYFRNRILQWNIFFTGPVHDWEVDWSLLN